MEIFNFEDPIDHPIFQFMDSITEDEYVFNERKNIGRALNSYGFRRLPIVTKDEGLKWTARVVVRSCAYDVFKDYSDGKIDFIDVSQIMNTMVDGTFNGYTRQQR